MLDTISNNLVWKFNKHLEFPKSIHRTSTGTVLRDKQDAYLFGLSKGDKTISNKIQFAQHVFVFPKYNPFSDKDFTPPCVLTFYPEFNIGKFIDPDVTLNILPYQVEDDTLHMRITSQDIRELLAYFGETLCKEIASNWSTYWKSEEVEMKLTMAEREIEDEALNSRNIIERISDFFSKSKPKWDEESLKKMEHTEKNIFNQFLEDGNFDLSYLSKPIMNRCVYDNIKDNAIKEELEKMVIVINIEVK